MYLDTAKKKELFKTYGGSETNTGSAEGQVALFTTRISHLTEHLKENRKDYNTQRSLINLVGKRRSLLKYIRTNDIVKYRELIAQLGIRDTFK
jgi:small subunit ribosomal protein S15